ncbi:pyruvate dehydrogenase (acetyl-transferring), homodimeric type [Aliiglaciecola sp. SL4]|uniref:pyruvate dehydrogenase (acetyl-transferring), homodimeric type n=1 Tax=Aliiglaciecola sp. SL4 TaxID=3239806 RepID=UPI00355C2A96
MTEILSDLLVEDRKEWLESIDYIRDHFGNDAVKDLLRDMQDYALSKGISVNEATLNTSYINSIPLSEQPVYPGDIELEKKIENIIRWNAMAIVLQAQDQGTGVGGHIATYASAATILEVGFNHFFKASSNTYGGDTVMPQPHAAPGIYARAFIEGRLTAQQLSNYRRELGEGGGLSSYPHPRSLPSFWQMPNASMGLSTPAAIYHARFSKYLVNRGLKADTGGKYWCFIGDGEADEPEVLGTINIASREKLNNLVLTVNCNLQRLDGPVRGNGKVIQELERSFRGADWNVIKVVWGSGWDVLLAQDSKGILRKRMDACLDGDYQRYSILPGGVQREHWVEGNAELEKMMNSLTDQELKQIKRGGQDPKKIFAAFQQASLETDKPTVILFKTVKGDGMGPTAEGRNTAHQKKDLKHEERIALARKYGIPISDEAAAKAELYRPNENSDEMRYLQEHRQNLNGYLPSRNVNCPSIPTPPLAFFADILKGSGDRKLSTTMVTVRLLAKLLKEKEIGKYIVPIVPDEARTFGMDGLFKAAGIYSHDGQNYTPVDADTLSPYREAKNGQILQEGICETGAIASFMAAGSAYALHNLPMIPFYVFYSIFGFQRVGDMIWSCGDMMCRGFLIGGTAGRTTLNGEGLQHQDGHSHILAQTVPNMVSYDPAFGYELAIIIRDGIQRMYTEQQDIFYYLTVYNENNVMPALPEDKGIAENILKGGYLFKKSTKQKGELINLLSSGSIMQQTIDAYTLLDKLGYRVNIWSITSFTELQRDGETAERWNRLHPTEKAKTPFVQTLFKGQKGVFIAATDYMKSYASSISRWIPGRYEVLGTDGYGLSESRENLRDFFEVSTTYIAHAAISALLQDERISKEQYQQHSELLNVDFNKCDPRTRS